MPLSKDPKTGLPVGEHGTALDAIEFIVNGSRYAPGEEKLFLEGWMQGDLGEWPEYYSWLKRKYGI